MTNLTMTVMQSIEVVLLIEYSVTNAFHYIKTIELLNFSKRISRVKVSKVRQCLNTTCFLLVSTWYLMSSRLFYGTLPMMYVLLLFFLVSIYFGRPFFLKVILFFNWVVPQCTISVDIVCNHTIHTVSNWYTVCYNRFVVIWFFKHRSGWIMNEAKITLFSAVVSPNVPISHPAQYCWGKVRTAVFDRNIYSFPMKLL